MEHRERRRWRRGLAAVALLVAVACVTSACGGSSDDGGSATTQAARAPAVPFSGPEAALDIGFPRPKPAPLKLLFLSPQAADGALHQQWLGFQQAVQELGGTAQEFDARLDPNRQLEGFDLAVVKDFDGVAYNAVDANAAITGIKRARAAGIPAIGLDWNPTDPADVAPATAQVVRGVDRLGYIAARELARRVEPGTKVGLIGISVSAPAVQAVVASAGKWAKRFGLDVVSSVPNRSGDLAGGEKAATELLNRNADVRGVIAFNDESAIATASVARQLGRKIVTVSTLGGSSLGPAAIKADKLAASVSADQRAIGATMAWGLYAAAAGSKLPKAVIGAKPVAITSDNVDQLGTAR